MKIKKNDERLLRKIGSKFRNDYEIVGDYETGNYVIYYLTYVDGVAQVTYENNKIISKILTPLDGGQEPAQIQ